MLGRLLALKVVASSDPTVFGEPGMLTRVRSALLDERWADAVSLWIDASGTAVDGYPDEDLWTDEALDAEFTSLELRMTRLFQDDG